MPSIRIGFSTDFNLVGEQVGIGTTNPTARLDVAGQILADNTAGSGGVSTLTRYDGFLHTAQDIGNTVSIAETTKGNLNSLSGEIKISGEVTVTGDTPIAGGRLESLTVTDSFDLPHGGSEYKDDAPEKGSTRFNQDLGQLEFYTGLEWRTVGSIADTGGRGRGVFPGGADPSATSSIDYINISTQGNALNFGSLDTATRNVTKASSEIRGIVYGGNNTTTSIDYITIASEGNAIDFGTCTASLAAGGCSSSTRAVFGGGQNPGLTNHIEYIQINTLGNGVLFGDLTQTRAELGGVSSPTRGVFAGGGAPSGSAPSSTIDFITIASIGDAIDFGDLIDRCGQLGGGCGNSTRGLFAGGAHAPKYLDIIQYITIATTGNATYFGDMSIPRVEQAGAASNSTRGTLVGGYTPGGDVNSIDYVTISSTGNAQDFGDLTVAKSRIGGGQISDSHGGLGGF